MAVGQAARHVLAAQRSWESFQLALQAFRVAMARENVDAMESERLEAVSAIESYLDNLAASVRIGAEDKKARKRGNKKA